MRPSDLNIVETTVTARTEYDTVLGGYDKTKA
jgi:hypothetical protein